MDTKADIQFFKHIFKIHIADIYHKWFTVSKYYVRPVLYCTDLTVEMKLRSDGWL